MYLDVSSSWAIEGFLALRSDKSQHYLRMCEKSPSHPQGSHSPGIQQKGQGSPLMHLWSHIQAHVGLRVPQFLLTNP